MRAFFTFLFLNFLEKVKRFYQKSTKSVFFRFYYGFNFYTIIFTFMEIQVIPIEFATPEYDEMVRLRYRVLREPLGLDYTPEQLATEYSDTLLVAFDTQQNLCACLIFTPQSAELLKMRQVAVAPEYQKKGIGQQLVAESERWARQNGYSKIVLNARENAIPFYEKLKYDVTNDWFQEINIPHKTMIKSL
ncbi:MAG: hypothetical protein RL757_1000 [Bacteroidota bacterium]|jgi:GNAT superfamily N-acetyltransferase